MAISYISMRPEGTPPRVGAFSSDGLHIETPWHQHDLHQLLYAFEDSVDVISQHARYKVPHQFAAWIPAGTAHRTAIQNVRSGSVFFRREMIHSPTDEVCVIPASNLMREMTIYAMRWPMDSEETPTSKLFFDCFASLCKEWIEHQVELVLPSCDDPRINAVAEFTHTHLATVTLPGVCKALGMSERSLRRHFRQAMGITREEFRLRLRVHAAIDALA